MTCSGAGTHWLDYNDYERQLEVAWLRLSGIDPPLNPRLIGEPRWEMELCGHSQIAPLGARGPVSKSIGASLDRMPAVTSDPSPLNVHSLIHRE